VQSPLQHRYLSLLRWETPVMIAMIITIVVITAASFGPEPMAVALFVGMIWRTQSCAVRSVSGPAVPGWWMVVLVPLWPAAVAVDAVWVWMQRMGFGTWFRVGVTATLFGLAWLPFIPEGSVAWVVVGGSGALTAWLRRLEPGWIYLLPSVMPIALMARV